MTLLEQRNQSEYLAGHLPTRLKGLDAALCGGVPFGVVTELVGPAGIGKTQVTSEIYLLISNVGMIHIRICSDIFLECILLVIASEICTYMPVLLLICHCIFELFCWYYLNSFLMDCSSA